MSQLLRSTTIEIGSHVQQCFFHSARNINVVYYEQKQFIKKHKHFHMRQEGLIWEFILDMAAILHCCDELMQPP